MLVGGLGRRRRHWHDGDLHQPAEHLELRKARLLPGLPRRDPTRFVLARIPVPADVQPGLLACVPAQQVATPDRVDDEGGRRQMQRQGSRPRIGRRGAEITKARHVLGIVRRRRRERGELAGGGLGQGHDAADYGHGREL